MGPRSVWCSVFAWRRLCRGLSRSLNGRRNQNTQTWWQPVSTTYLAGFYQVPGRYEQAEPPLQRALGICMKSPDPKHPHTVQVRENYLALLSQTHPDGDMVTPLQRCHPDRPEHLMDRCDGRGILRALLRTGSSKGSTLTTIYAQTCHCPSCL